jgi:hypothetical protein
MMYAGIIAGAILLVLVLSTVFYSFKHDKVVTPSSVKIETRTLEVADKSDKVKLEAIERKVFEKADRVKQMASQRTKTAIMKVPIRLAAAAAPSIPASSLAIERTSNADPMNESSVLKSISNKVEHVKRLSQDF